MVTGAAPVWTTTPLYVCVSVTVCPKVFVLVIVPTHTLVHVLAHIDVTATELVLVLEDVTMQNGQIQNVLLVLVADTVDDVEGVLMETVVVTDGVIDGGVVAVVVVATVTVVVARVTIVL